MDPRGPRAAPPLNHGDLEGEQATQTQKRQYSIHTDGRDRQIEKEKRDNMQRDEAESPAGQLTRSKCLNEASKF